MNSGERTFIEKVSFMMFILYVCIYLKDRTCALQQRLTFEDVRLNRQLIELSWRDGVQLTLDLRKQAIQFVLV